MQLPEQNPNKDYEFVNHNSRKPKKAISPLMLGLIFIASGAVASYFFIYLKLKEMEAHADAISYSMKLLMVGPMLVIFGLYFVLVKPSDINAQSPRDKKWLYVFVGIFIVAMIVLYQWFDKMAEGYGYSI